MKIRRLSKVGGRPERETKVAVTVIVTEPERRVDLVEEARRCWDNMSRFRDERSRNRRYTFGEQWGDSVTVDGVRMTEGEYIRSTGSEPMSNNMIQRIVRNMLGVWRNQNSEPVCVARDNQEQPAAETMTTVLQCNGQRNGLTEVNARTFQDFLIGGLAVYRKWYGWRESRLDCWTDYVNPQNFFIDSNMRDFRGWDCNLVGEIHDVEWPELCSQLAKTPLDIERLARIYGPQSRGYRGVGVDDFGRARRGSEQMFHESTDPALCRVIELWKKEMKVRYRVHDRATGEVYKIEVEDYGAMVTGENARRLSAAVAEGVEAEDVALVEAEWMLDNRWVFYYLSPWGDILAQGETPYAHNGHPYVFAAYPFIDGEIHSFVNDIIDQQRYVNRLVTMYDFIIGASAKGVLMVPTDSLPDGVSPEQFAKAWRTHDGVLFYEAKPGVPVPHQVSANSTNIGIGEMLQTQLKFLEDISGVNGAIQGKQMYSGMAASLYAQQTQNATTSLVDIFDTFSRFLREGAEKDVKNIQQFYSEERILDIAGESASRLPRTGRRINDIDFDLSVTESTATPAYRSTANQVLMEIWRSGQIDIETVLELGTLPYSSELLQKIQSRREEAAQAQQGAVGAGIDPAALAALAGGAEG